MKTFHAFIGVLCVYMFYFTCYQAKSDSWPHWRGPGRNGNSPTEETPLKWNGHEGIQWKTELPGVGYSSPVVSNDRVFLTATSGPKNDRLHVIAFDVDRGNILWHRRFFGLVMRKLYKTRPPRGKAVPTIAVAEGNVVAVFGTGDIVCLDIQGRPKWFRSLAEEYGPIENEYGWSTSPVIEDGKVFLQVDHDADSYLIAIDLHSGITRWRTLRPLANDNWSTPAIISTQGMKQIVCLGTRRLDAYRLNDGTPLWFVEGGARQCCPTPIVVDQEIYVSSDPGGVVMKIQPNGQSGDQSLESVIWSSRSGTAFVPSAIVARDHYFSMSDRGILSCLDLETGDMVEQKRIGGRYYASPLYAGGKLFFTNLEGKTTVVQAGAKLEVLAENELGEPVAASPAIAQGRLFLRGSGHLFCIDGIEGKHTAQQARSAGDSERR